MGITTFMHIIYMDSANALGTYIIVNNVNYL